MHQTATAPRHQLLNDAEQLDLMILSDLAEPRAHTARGPACIAARIGLDRLTIFAAVERLEGEQRLIRWMGLRPSESGYKYLNELNRRT